MKDNAFVLRKYILKYLEIVLYWLQSVCVCVEREMGMVNKD